MATPRPVIAGNWKMNLGPEDSAEFFRSFQQVYPPDASRTVLFFPPALSFAAAVQAVGSREDIRLGVQNVHWEASGAFTGELSAAMARQAGAEFVLVGHSERRHLFGESSADTERKVSAVLGEGLVAVLCVGETLDERRGGRAEKVVADQLAAVLDGLSQDSLDSLLIAYEPVWAIGTGETASPGDAAEMHGAIRRDLARRFGEAAAANLPLLYGGSVKPDNAEELLAANDVDGVLVGGASLDPSGFARICAAGT